MMHIFCQIAGKALRMPSATLRTLLDRPRRGCAKHLLGYAQNFLIQVASSALAYATQTIEARLARWLLMCIDRLEGSEIAMTHEAFALMLGVRRAGVTVAIQSLEAKGAITARRAALTVVNRAILAEIAGEFVRQRRGGVRTRRSGVKLSDLAPARWRREVAAR